MAVLVVNNNKQQLPGVSFSPSLVNLTGSYSMVDVFDIWAQKSIGTVEKGKNVTTGNLTLHDSAFYLLTAMH